MSNQNWVISDFTAGSSLTVQRTLTRIPDGSLVQTAVFAVNPDQAGSEYGGIILKAITTVDQTGAGQVENQGRTGTCQLRFELTESDTILLTPNHPYNYSIDVSLDRSLWTTVEKGKITANPAPLLSQNGDSPDHEQHNGNGIWQAARDARRAIEARARDLMKLSADAKESGDIEAMDSAEAELADLRQQYKRHSVAERAACIAHASALYESLPARLEAAQLAQFDLEAEYQALLEAQQRERAELAGKLDQARAAVLDIETQLTANSRTFNEAEAGFQAAIQRVSSSGPFT
jgi:hypothetical protein